LPASLIVAAACCAVAAAIASAAAPMKGRAYVGSSSDGPVRFQVSSDGKSLSDFFGGHFNAGGCQSNTVGNVLPTTGKIKNGRFTIKWSHNRVSATFTGQFLAHGQAKGTSVFFWPSPFGTGGCQNKFSWTVKALPANGNLCANHIGPPHNSIMGSAVGAEASESNITAIGVTCPAVNSALDAGMFKSDSANGYTGVGAFTTPGWKCTESDKNNYRCSRATPKAAFSFILGGDPCGNIESIKPGPECQGKPAADVRRTA